MQILHIPVGGDVASVPFPMEEKDFELLPVRLYRQTSLNNLRPMASRYLKFPVTRTGCYENRLTGNLEFWFVMGDKRSKCGECKGNLPPSVKAEWEIQVRRDLQELIFRNIADGTLRFDAGPVDQLKGRIVG